MIRRCSDADLLAIETIINEAANVYRGVIPTDCWHEPYMTRADLMSEIAAGVNFWGWDEAGALIGVMGLQKLPDATLVRHAYVSTAHQGRGIGGALLTMLAGQVTGPLLVGTWAAAEWAIRFYKRHGFRLVSNEERDRLLNTYWSIPLRQQEVSVVLARSLQNPLVSPNSLGYKEKKSPMEKLGSGVITTTRDVDCVEFDWGKIHFLSEPAVTNANRFSFGIVELAQGKGHTRHNHPGAEEIIYVVSGEGEQMVDDQPPVKVGPGASIYIPADIYHSTVNTGTEPMKLIVVYSPAGPERLLREIPGAKVIPATR